MCDVDKQTVKEEYIIFFKRYMWTRLAIFVGFCVPATVVTLAISNLIVRVFGIWLFFYGCTRLIQFLDVRESYCHHWSVVPRKIQVKNISKIMINNDTYSIIYLNHKKIKLEENKEYHMEYLSHTHGRYIVKAVEVEEEEK